jgi:hypothetical protein
MLVVPHQSTFGEDERPVRGKQLLEQSSDDAFGVSVTVHRRRIDPVHTKLDRVSHGAERFGVVLLPPAESPSATANGPGPEADSADQQVGVAEGTSGEGH